MQAPLRLDEFVVESLHIRTKVEGDFPVTESETPSLSVDVDILRAGEESRFLIPLTVRINHQHALFERHGFALELKLLGFFTFDSDTDEHEVGHLISLNAPSILYGIARGIVAQALALTSVGKYILPSVNFVELMRRRETKPRASRRRRASGIDPDGTAVPDGARRKHSGP